MSDTITLRLRSQKLVRDAQGHNRWRVLEQVEDVRPDRMALVLCDVWDRHWCQGAVRRLEAMVPRMRSVVEAARGLGVHIVHAPSETMDFYKGWAARERVLACSRLSPTEVIVRDDVPLPIDDSDEGCDTEASQPKAVWTRQHPGIPIDEEWDVISDDGVEIYSYLQAQQVEQVLIMGVHTNMCILNRSFGIKQMVRWGISMALLRDLTDAMYNPASRPYVSHREGTQLVVRYIEQFWCPTAHSDDILMALEEWKG